MYLFFTNKYESDIKLIIFLTSSYDSTWWRSSNLLLADSRIYAPQTADGPSLFSSHVFIQSGLIFQSVPPISMELCIVLE